MNATQMKYACARVDRMSRDRKALARSKINKDSTTLTPSERYALIKKGVVPLRKGVTTVTAYTGIKDQIMLGDEDRAMRLVEKYAKETGETS